VKVVPDLQGESVHPGGKLHVDHVLPVAEVHPWRSASDLRARRQTVGIDATG
jgi:hypothetical protein